MSWGADSRADLGGGDQLRAAHLRVVRLDCVRNKSLRTIAPTMPTPLPSRLSSVTLFSRSETRGMPQKSVSEADWSTTLARVSAASPVMPLWPTLQNKRGQIVRYGVLTLLERMQGHVQGALLPHTEVRRSTTWTPPLPKALSTCHESFTTMAWAKLANQAGSMAPKQFAM